MLGISYSEAFLLLGATAALIGPKDLPIITKAAGTLAGRAIGYVQVARGQFESVMQQSQARQVHKELQDTMAQLEAIRHEIRSVPFMNPGPLTTRLVDNVTSQIPAPNAAVDLESPKYSPESTDTTSVIKGKNPNVMLSDIHSQASAYSRLAESTSLVTNSMDKVLSEFTGESGRFTVLPISADCAKLLPCQQGNLRGSDILVESVVEADVARNAKGFFSDFETLQKKNESIGST